MMSRPLLKLMILTQIFTLLAVLAMPYLIRILPAMGGKILYGILMIFCIGLSILLRRSLVELDVHK